MPQNSLSIIGDIINNAYARARNAWCERNLEGYQNLARIQTKLGAKFLDLNLDGTQAVMVRVEEMLEFLPKVIPAIQEVTRVPLCFDNPNVEYHKAALRHYDRGKSGQPILNSIAASRERLEEMIALVGEYDTKVIVMASEQMNEAGESAQCLNSNDAHQAARYFVKRLIDEAGRRPDDIIIDVGLAPVGADTYGLVNIGLDAMKLIRADADLKDCHLTVGLSNFAWGTPKAIRHNLERAYLTLAMRRGLDFTVANPEKIPGALEEEHPLVAKLQAALERGRRLDGESQEEAGFRQAEAVMEICSEVIDD